MVADSGGDIKVFIDKLKGWFNESMHRNTGWYKRMMRLVSFLLGLGLALTFNIDSIQIAQLLSRDKEARGQLVNLAVGVAHDTLLANNYGNSSASSDRSSAIVDSSLAHVSQDISLANYVLGLGWGFDRLGNKVADTVRFSTSRDAFCALYDLRIGADTMEFYRRELRTDQLKLRAVKRYIGMEESLHISPEKQDTQYKDSLKHLTERVDKYILYLFTDSLRSYEAIVDRVDTLTRNNFFAVGAIDTITQSTDSLIIIHGLTPYSDWHKVRYWWHSVFGSGLLRLLGLILTAIALSLGAPFWFDMLAKIVAIRGSGGVPTPPPPKQVVIIPDPVLINIGGPVVPPSAARTAAFHADRYRRSELSRRLHGGIRCPLIEEGLQEIAGSMVDVIEIHVLDNPTGIRITILLGNPYQSFPLNLLTTTQG